MTIAEVLAPFGVAEDEFAAELARELAAPPGAGTARLTAAEEAVLLEHGGATAPTGDERSTARAVLRSVSSNLAEQTRESLSVEQAARRLGVDASRVRHRVRDRALYAFKIGADLRLPTWQFDRGSPIPGLRSVLAALPKDLHPLEVAGLMTTPDPDLSVDRQARCARDWLIGGGDAAAVVERIRQTDTW